MTRRAAPTIGGLSAFSQRWLWRSSLMLAVVVCSPPRIAPAAPVGSSSSPVLNGTFESGTDGVPSGWQVVAGKGTIHQDTQERAEGSASLRIDAEPKQEIQVASAPLPLSPLRIYQVELRAKRTHGNQLSFWVEEKSLKGEQRAGLQLHWPGRIRPNWWLVAPYWERYHAFFSTRSNAISWRFIIKQKGDDDRIGRFCWIDDISIVEIANVKPPRGAASNILPPEVARFVPDADGFPASWSLWWGDRSKLQSMPQENAPACFLRVGNGNYGLVPGYYAVEFGRTYRFSIDARGKGSMSMAIHQLADHPDYWCRADTALRVGDAHSLSFDLDTQEWRKLSGTWVAEIPGMRWFNPYIALSGAFELRQPELREE
ncbi:MAG: hypothetical protein AUJ92_18830 [Armatimonadetes bacterium CG2_30_59_28]|nr:hypothetical protein [Armatimonadota bacterium]OIO90433.1 MAG: hypothetical protein AUJ92_18830 [Armatimonadetes bacterium CG2_30_59_28]PIU66138.1 MAG: hypothetical protein COS85_06015 [Armatimonadetes bacterium CG07_land_8_20_14_0_80_59_28]PIY41631.1 MAG: hypothetical protein COZ05_15420 [Armatimonadetes bacterium CG_4_10_14_3_um_filter_59_10]PJB74593.1 MAG: hypothetical protein CO095_04680 [Armatimonadetes bacterium CG_4_9_14_3_um_filter_58_7]